MLAPSVSVPNSLERGFSAWGDVAPEIQGCGDFVGRHDLGSMLTSSGQRPGLLLKFWPGPGQPPGLRVRSPAIDPRCLSDTFFTCSRPRPLELPGGPREEGQPNVEKREGVLVAQQPAAWLWIHYFGELVLLNKPHVPCFQMRTLRLSW